MLAQPKEKIERRLGERLFLKGERSISPKAAVARRPYPPGMHGKRTRRSRSEFALELREKQKVRYIYGLDDKKLKRYFIEARRNRNMPTDQTFAELLERRLDNVVYRLGFAVSRGNARHLVNHGHIFVRDRRVRQPSYLIRAGDIIRYAKPSMQAIQETLEAHIKKHTPPDWLERGKDVQSGSVRRLPRLDDIAGQQNMSLVIEYYSR